MDYSYIPVPEDSGINVELHTFFIGVDLGQSFDYTAISVIERIISAAGTPREQRRYHLRHLERMRGVSYVDVCDRVRDVYLSQALGDYERALVIDLTGVGRPVYDLLRQIGFRYALNAVSITGGAEVNRHGAIANVPKRELVSNLQIHLADGSLRFAKGMREANTLVEELANFQTQITAAGHDTYNGRTGVHDDIVMSVALAAWLATQRRCRMSGRECL